MSDATIETQLALGTRSPIQNSSTLRSPSVVYPSLTDAEILDVVLNQPIINACGRGPGGLISFINAPAVNYNDFESSYNGGSGEGAGMTVGLSDVDSQTSFGSGIGTIGLVNPGRFDAGSTGTNPGYAFAQTIGFASYSGQARGQFNPQCWRVDADYDSVSGVHEKAFALALGNNACTRLVRFALNTTTGNQSITGVGFTPDMVVFLSCCQDDGVLGVDKNGANQMFGVMDAAGGQWAMCYRSNFDSDVFTDTNARNGQFVNDGCIIHVPGSNLGAAPARSTVAQRAHFVSMDPDGFTFNLTAAGADSHGDVMYVWALAIRIIPSTGNLACGVTTQGAATITPGFAPNAMLFGSAQAPNNNVLHSAYLTLGLTDGFKQRCVWTGSDSNQPGVGTWAPTYSYTSDQNCVFMSNYTQAVLAKATATFAGSTVNMHWQVDNGAGNQLGWIAFNTTSIQNAIPVVTTSPATSVLPSTVTFNGDIVPNTPICYPVDYYWQWGTGVTPTFTHQSIVTSDGSGFVDDVLSYVLANPWSHGTTFLYFRLVAVDDAGVCTVISDYQQVFAPDWGIFRTRFRTEESPGLGVGVLMTNLADTADDAFVYKLIGTGSGVDELWVSYDWYITQGMIGKMECCRGPTAFRFGDISGSPVAVFDLYGDGGFVYPTTVDNYTDGDSDQMYLWGRFETFGSSVPCNAHMPFFSANVGANYEICANGPLTVGWHSISVHYKFSTDVLVYIIDGVTYDLTGHGWLPGYMSQADVVLVGDIFGQDEVLFTRNVKAGTGGPGSTDIIDPSFLDDPTLSGFDGFSAQPEFGQLPAVVGPGGAGETAQGAFINEFRSA